MPIVLLSLAALTVVLLSYFFVLHNRYIYGREKYLKITLEEFNKSVEHKKVVTDVGPFGTFIRIQRKSQKLDTDDVKIIKTDSPIQNDKFPDRKL